MNDEPSLNVPPNNQDESAISNAEELSVTEVSEQDLNPVTPQKQVSEANVDPLTPTANLKMLVSAVSPELRHRERLKKQSKGILAKCGETLKSRKVFII